MASRTNNNKIVKEYKIVIDNRIFTGIMYIAIWTVISMNGRRWDLWQ